MKAQKAHINGLDIWKKTKNPTFKGFLSSYPKITVIKKNPVFSAFLL